MSDQPRWPRGTPVGPDGHGPGGGRYRMSSGEAGATLAALAQYRQQLPSHRRSDWARAISARLDQPHRHTRGLMSHEQVASYVDREDYRITGTTSGGMGEVQFRTYSDGTRLVYKKLDSGNQSEADAEVETSVVARALGAPTPAVVQAPTQWGKAVLMEYVEDDAASMGVAARWNMVDRMIGSDPGPLIGLLDLIVGNHDRHPGNVIVTPDGMVGIDHGMAFRAIRYGGPMPSGAATFAGLRQSASRFAHPLFSGNGFGWFSREAIQEARRRLAGLEHQIDPDHWQGIQDTLDVLEANSTGAHPLD